MRSAEDLEESVDITAAFESSVCVGKHAFSKMEADHDKERRAKLSKSSPDVRAHDNETEVARARRYERRLRRAHDADLTDMNSLRFLYWSGFDRHNRRVVVVIGKHFPADSIDYDKVPEAFSQLAAGICNEF